MRNAQKPVTSLPHRVMLPHCHSLGPEPPSPIPGALDAEIQRARFRPPAPGLVTASVWRQSMRQGRSWRQAPHDPVFLASRIVVQTNSLGPSSGTKGAGAPAEPHCHPKHSNFLGRLQQVQPSKSDTPSASQTPALGTRDRSVSNVRRSRPGSTKKSRKFSQERPRSMALTSPGRPNKAPNTPELPRILTSWRDPHDPRRRLLTSDPEIRKSASHVVVPSSHMGSREYLSRAPGPDFVILIASDLHTRISTSNSHQHSLTPRPGVVPVFSTFSILPDQESIFTNTHFFLSRNH